MTSQRTLAFPLAACFLLVATLLVLVAPAGHARVSAVGLVDYTKKNFKVGDWVRYRIDASNDLGNEDMSYQEVRIVGEDTFRGEKCFWIETWTGSDSARASYDLSLVSYDAFKDPDSDVTYKFYVRMVLFGVDEEGVPEIFELRPSTPTKDVDLRPLRGERDTLGVESVPTAKGVIDANLVRLQRKIRNPRQMADSTVNRITDIVRKTWMARTVPVTSVVKEEEVNKRLTQSYAVGQPSTSTPEILIDTLFRTATVVDWGTGAKSDLLTTWRKHRGFLKLESSRPGLGVEDPTDMPR